MTKEEHYEKGMEHFSEDRLDEAIGELHRAIDADPYYADALHALAMSYYHQGNVDRAIDFGLRFREAAADDPLAYTSLSMFYNAKGMIREAEEMGAKANALPPPSD